MSNTAMLENILSSEVILIVTELDSKLSSIIDVPTR